MVNLKMVTFNIRCEWEGTEYNGDGINGCISGIGMIYDKISKDDKTSGIRLGTPAMTTRGLKEEEWFVVRNANMPSVLVEVGFVSNPEEALLLSDRNYLRKIALGIYNGVSSFVTHFEHSRGFTISQ